MTKACSSCEAMAPADARFCRHCGAVLQPRRASDDAAPVSPLASTVPLSKQTSTDEIIAPPARTSFTSQTPPPTSEVSREDLSDLLHGSSSSPLSAPRAPGDNGGGRGAASNFAARTTRSDRLESTPEHRDPEQTQITIPVRPLTVNTPHAAATADVNLLAPRATAKAAPHFNHAPQPVTLSPSADATTTQTITMQTATTTMTPAPHSTESRALRLWLGGLLAAISLLIIATLTVALWFGAHTIFRRTTTPAAAVTTNGEISVAAPLPVADPKQLSGAKMAEAATLIASGNTREAAARLREAAALDPSNAEPHRQLARLLLASGARRESIEELRAAMRLAPDDTESRLALAAAQSAEGLHAEAVETYRRLDEASPAAFAADTVQLAYADALRLAGRTTEAGKIYRRLAASSSDAEVARASKQRLVPPLLPPDAPQELDINDARIRTAENTAREQQSRAEAAASRASQAVDAARLSGAHGASSASTAAPSANSPSPADRYGRGVALWATNRAAAVAELRAASSGGNSDASYYLGLSIAEGRDPRTLNRADLIAALVHFGRARSGKFRAQAVTYEDRLGKELDRRRNAER